MRKIRFFAFALFAGGLLSAQVPLPIVQRVTHDFDKNANFGAYKTYKWVSISNSDQLDQLTADQLLGTFEFELEKKGLTKNGADDPDLFIGYQITNGKQKPSSSEAIGGSYGSAGGASASAGASTTIVHTGLLTLLMYDGKNKQLLWRGTVSGAIDAEGKPERKQDLMNRGIEKLLKDYPPTKKH
jgi:Domain of unknown function (DUF4136)